MACARFGQQVICQTAEEQARADALLAAAQYPGVNVSPTGGVFPDRQGTPVPDPTSTPVPGQTSTPVPGQQVPWETTPAPSGNPYLDMIGSDGQLASNTLPGQGQPGTVTQYDENGNPVSVRPLTSSDTQEPSPYGNWPTAPANADVPAPPPATGAGDPSQMQGVPGASGQSLDNAIGGPRGLDPMGMDFSPYAQTGIPGQTANYDNLWAYMDLPPWMQDAGLSSAGAIGLSPLADPVTWGTAFAEGTGIQNPGGFANRNQAFIQGAPGLSALMTGQVPVGSEEDQFTTQLMQQLLQPVGETGGVVDARSIWDQAISGGGNLAAMGMDPNDFESGPGAMQGVVNILAPYIGESMYGVLSQMLAGAEQQWRLELAKGNNVSFPQFLQTIGAQDWM